MDYWKVVLLVEVVECQLNVLLDVDLSALQVEETEEEIEEIEEVSMLDLLEQVVDEVQL